MARCNRLSLAATSAVALLVLVAALLSRPTPAGALPLGAKVCRITDKCSKALLSAPPGKVVGDSCGSEYLLLATCRARKLKACTYKDKCTKKMVKVVRGGVTKDGCGKTWRVTDTCKLVATSAKCYKKCYVPPAKKTESKARGVTPTCAAKCK